MTKSTNAQKSNAGFWCCKVDRITGEFISIKRFWTYSACIDSITSYGLYEIINIDLKKVVKRIDK